MVVVGFKMGNAAAIILLYHHCDSDMCRAAGASTNLNPFRFISFHGIMSYLPYDVTYIYFLTTRSKYLVFIFIHVLWTPSFVVVLGSE